MPGTYGWLDNAVKLKFSLSTRLAAWITILVSFLVMTILFVIQRREVSTIFEETKNRGLLIASYVAYMNLRPLILWDLETIQKNVEDQADDNLVYIVFYDRAGKPLVMNEDVRDDPEIYGGLHLSGDVRPDSRYYSPRTVNLHGRSLDVLEIEIPIFAAGSPARWGALRIGHSLQDMRAEVRKTRQVLIFIGFTGILLGLLGAALFARRVTRPLIKLAEGTVRISQGNFSQHIGLDSKDEIGDLARSFNAMTGQLLQTRERMEAANRRLIQAEKLASIGRLAATIAHEIRNPLTSVKLNIQKLSESQELSEVEREHLNLSQEGIAQIEKFVKELLNFTRASELNLERFSMEQIMDESLKMMRDSFLEKKIAVEKKYEDGLPAVLADGDKLRQVFMNVLRNALEATEEGGRIGVFVGLAEENGRKNFRVKISDTGCGIPAKDWENIFEPFFTTKSAGFGLGLANARKIVEQHNGQIRVAKKRGKGSAFVIMIPCEENP